MLRLRCGLSSATFRSHVGRHMQVSYLICRKKTATRIYDLLCQLRCGDQLLNADLARLLNNLPDRDKHVVLGQGRMMTLRFVEFIASILLFTKAPSQVSMRAFELRRWQPMICFNDGSQETKAARME